MTGADVARFGTAIPGEAPSAAPPEATPEPSRTTVDVNGQRVADTTGPVPTAEAIRNARARSETITTPEPAPPKRDRARRPIWIARTPRWAPPRRAPRSLA